MNLTGLFAHFYVLQLAHEQLKAYATISPHPDGKTHFTNADFVHAYKRLKPGHGALNRYTVMIPFVLVPSFATNASFASKTGNTDMFRIVTTGMQCRLVSRDYEE